MNSAPFFTMASSVAIHGLIEALIVFGEMLSQNKSPANATFASRNQHDRITASVSGKADHLDETRAKVRESVLHIRPSVRRVNPPALEGTAGRASPRPISEVLRMNPTTDVPVRHQRCAGVGEQPVAGHMIDVKVRVDSEFDGEVQLCGSPTPVVWPPRRCRTCRDDDAIVTEDEPALLPPCTSSWGC